MTIEYHVPPDRPRHCHGAESQRAPNCAAVSGSHSPVSHPRRTKISQFTRPAANADLPDVEQHLLRHKIRLDLSNEKRIVIEVQQ